MVNENSLDAEPILDLSTQQGIKKRVKHNHKTLSEESEKNTPTVSKG